MSQQPSGWYDDPSDPDLLRYWDGVTWSSHTAPRRSPTPSPGQEDGTGAAGAPAGSGWQQASAPSYQSAPPTQSGWQGQVQQSPQGGSNLSPGQYPGAPGASNWMHALPTTVDGVELAGWGRRLGAWLIDGVILFVLSIVVSRLLTPEVWTAFGRAMEMVAQNPNNSVVTDAAGRDFADVVVASSAKLGISLFVMNLVYCVGFWTTLAQTPGKLAVGISVRRADRPGPLDLVTALKRRLLTAVQLLPVVGVFWWLLNLLDGLWPLWDPRRQALHDKVAATQVVVGKQPRPGADQRLG